MTFDIQTFIDGNIPMSGFEIAIFLVCLFSIVTVAMILMILELRRKVRQIKRNMSTDTVLTTTHETESPDRMGWLADKIIMGITIIFAVYFGALCVACAVVMIAAVFFGVYLWQ